MSDAQERGGLVSAVDLHLRAIDVLEEAMRRAPTPGELLARTREDIEVLSRQDLLRLVAVLAADAARAVGPAGRPHTVSALGRMRLEAMVEGG